MPKILRNDATPKRKRLNMVEKRERRVVDWQLFIKLMGRKAQRGVEPNDRKHCPRGRHPLWRLDLYQFYDPMLQVENISGQSLTACPCR